MGGARRDELRRTAARAAPDASARPSSGSPGSAAAGLTNDAIAAEVFVTPQDGRGEPVACLPQARDPLARAARPRARRAGAASDSVGFPRFARRPAHLASDDMESGERAALSPSASGPTSTTAPSGTPTRGLPSVRGRARGVRYLGSILLREDEVVLCQFEGTASGVRKVVECAEVPFERILETTTYPAQGGTHDMYVEIDDAAAVAARLPGRRSSLTREAAESSGTPPAGPFKRLRPVNGTTSPGRRDRPHPRRRPAPRLPDPLRPIVERARLARRSAPRASAGPQLQALAGWPAGQPGLLRFRAGRSRAVFGAISPSNVSSVWGVTSSDGGATWSAPANVGGGGPNEALAYGADVTAAMGGHDAGARRCRRRATSSSRPASAAARRAT